MLRSLLYYRGVNIAVVLGVAVAGSVLIGAFMVGDSVRESLRSLTLDRLGNIDTLLACEHLFDQGLAQGFDFDTSQTGNTPVEPVLLLRGGATYTPENQARRASGIQINGVTTGFLRLFPNQDNEMFTRTFPKESGQIFPSAVVNQRLAEELGLEPGGELVLSFENPSDIHRDSLYGRKKTSDVIRKLRVVVKAVIPDEGPGRFGLAAHQTAPMNVFVPLREVQRALGQRRRVNGLLFARPASNGQGLELPSRLKQVITPDHLNLKIRREETYVSLETPAFYLKPAVMEAAMIAAAEHGMAALPLSTYLANGIRNRDRQVPYSLVTGLDMANPLVSTPDTVPPGEGEMFLNQWAADNLNAQPGDTLTLTYYQVGAGDSLETKTANLRLTGILPMAGLGTDSKLAPDFPGVHDADDMSAWDPPFELDLDLIRPKDEAYWDSYRTAPKAFLSLATGLELWGNRFGEITAIRLGPISGLSLEASESRFLASFLAALDPAAAGFSWLPLREQGLRASVGSNDFRGLFLAFSFFIIISAALLVGLFFRLSVEQRRGEVGIRRAMGFAAQAVRRTFLGEGLVLCGLGALLSVLGGFAYADLVMAGLRHWWFLGTSRLFFHFEPSSLLWGVLITFLVALVSIWLTLRRIGKLPITLLVAGGSEMPARRPGRRARWTAMVFTLLAVVLLASSAIVQSPVGIFFGAGSCLLVAALAWMAVFQAGRPGSGHLGGLLQMAARNTARHAGRSLVCVSLVASACFTMVAVGLYRNTGAADPDRLDSGTGGYFLEARADVPLRRRIDDAVGREALGLPTSLAGRLDQTEVVSLRVLPGEDASCLNLFAPQKPRLLGLPDPVVFQGRFSFQSHLAAGNEDPWRLLNRRFADGAIPAIGDQNSVMWILHLGLGDDFVIENSAGQEVRLRLVGLLKGSLFQSELIISETHFLKNFPEQSGYGYFLFDAEPPERENLAADLEEILFDYGFDAGSTVTKIKSFHAIENTYIAIFQMLGGLGLLLGTLGLGAIIYRNALERRGEFAAMRAFGFRKARIAGLLLVENAILLVLGAGSGALSAVVAMAPHWLAGHADPSFGVLAVTLLSVFLVGMTASAWAVRATQRLALAPALRAK